MVKRSLESVCKFLRSEGSVLHSVGGRKKTGTGGELSGGDVGLSTGVAGEPGDGPSVSVMDRGIILKGGIF